MKRISENLIRSTSFLLLSALFFFLPGQNFYLTNKLTFKSPLVQALPIPLIEPAPYPIQNTTVQAPILTAQSALVLDIPSSTILYAKNPNQPLLPASTTKIMTGIVALDHYDLDDILTVKTVENRGKTMGLKTGERMTLENLLYGLLVHSANDAAYTIAENYPGGVDNFVSAMNKKAEKMNMKNTHFLNPSGLEQENHYSSSIDLARLSVYALKNPTFVKIMETQKLSVMDVEQKEAHPLETVNKLLGRVWGVYGIKTGWTENAGECLVAVIERGGRKILTVVLGSQDRFGETERLIEWAFQNHQWLTLPIAQK